MTRLFLYGFVLAALLPAAERVIVYPAQLAGPYGADTGKLVIVGDQMVFVDDASPANSFAISRSDIGGLNVVNGVTTFTMRQPYAFPTGSGSTLALRFVDPNSPGAVSTWVGIPLSTLGTANRVVVTPGAAAPGAVEYEYNVRHDDENGRLVVGPYDVHFESFKHREHSRTWPYAEIKQFRRDGDGIKLEPYRGDTAKFRIEGGQPMTEEVYNLIGDRIVAARRR